MLGVQVPDPIQAFADTSFNSNILAEITKASHIQACAMSHPMVPSSPRCAEGTRQGAPCTLHHCAHCGSPCTRRSTVSIEFTPCCALPSPLYHPVLRRLAFPTHLPSSRSVGPSLLLVRHVPNGPREAPGRVMGICPMAQKRVRCQHAMLNH